VLPEGSLTRQYGPAVPAKDEAVLLLARIPVFFPATFAFEVAPQADPAGKICEAMLVADMLLDVLKAFPVNSILQVETSDTNYSLVSTASSPPRAAIVCDIFLVVVLLDRTVPRRKGVSARTNKQGLAPLIAAKTGHQLACHV
jgi:hypothetical protein